VFIRYDGLKAWMLAIEGRDIGAERLAGVTGGR